LKRYCAACPGKPIKLKWTEDNAYRKIFMGEGSIAVGYFKTPPCKNCKAVIVFYGGDHPPLLNNEIAIDISP